MIGKILVSSVGQKYLMAISGIVWAGFLLGHMAGNLLLFVSPDAYNSYGHALTSGYFIYAVETVLIASLVAHILLAIILTLKNKTARGQGYSSAQRRDKGSSLQSRTMAIHGLFILAFIILHLMSFKFGPHYETNVQGVIMRDIYRLLVEIFKQPIYVGWYFLCLLLLGLHLSHGIQSVFQSLGLLHPAYSSAIKKLAVFYSITVTVGFIAQPVFIFFFVN